MTSWSTGRLAAIVALAWAAACGDPPAADAGADGSAVGDAGARADAGGPDAGAPDDAPPVASIVRPTGEPRLEAGGSLVLEARCDDPEGAVAAHAWDFDGASGRQDTGAPGAVQFHEARPHRVTYACTDASGASSNLATLRVQVGAVEPRVALVGELTRRGRTELELVTLGASAPYSPEPIVGTWPLGRAVAGPERVVFSGSSRFLAFVGDLTALRTDDVFVVDLLAQPLDARNASGLGASRDVGALTLSSDGAWMAYTTEPTSGVNELYVVEVAGGAPVRVSDRFANGGRYPAGRRAADALTGELAWAPDAPRLVFLRTDARSSDREAYAYDAGSTGAPVRLHAALVSSSAGVSAAYPLSGSRALLVADLDGARDVHLADGAGASAVAVAGLSAVGGRVGFSGRDVAVSADGSAAVFLGSLTSRVGLFHVARDGRASRVDADDGDVREAVWAPAGDAYAFVVERGGDEALFVGDGVAAAEWVAGRRAGPVCWRPDGAALAAVLDDVVMGGAATEPPRALLTPAAAVTDLACAAERVWVARGAAPRGLATVAWAPASAVSALDVTSGSGGAGAVAGSLRVAGDGRVVLRAQLTPDAPQTAIVADASGFAPLHAPLPDAEHRLLGAVAE